MRPGSTLLPVFGLATLLLAVALLLQSPPLASSPTAPGSIGSEEQPDARWAWEQQRLVNPATGRLPVRIRQREQAYAHTLPVHLPATDGRGRKTTALSSWTAQGPFNVGGRTRAFAQDISDGDVLLAGGVSGGMWRSDDNGVSWTKATGPDQQFSVTTVAQDTRLGRTNVWYFGSGEGRGNSAGLPSALFYANNSYYGNGLYKSVDGGASWFPLTATQSQSSVLFDSFFDIVWRVATDPSNVLQDEVYAATYNFIQRSTDGGDSWTRVLGTDAENALARYTDVAVSSTGVVYATLSNDNSAGGIWRSIDGITWVNLTPPGFPSDFDRVVLDIAPSDENTVFFLARSPGSGTNGHSLYRYEYVSGDGTGTGGVWTDLSANLPDRGGFTGTYDSQSNYNMFVEVKPDDIDVVVIGGRNIWRSDDGFTSDQSTSWIGGYTATNTSFALYRNHHPDQHAFVFDHRNPTQAYSASDGGVHRTPSVMQGDGNVAWLSLNNGYLTSQFYAVALDEQTDGDGGLIGGMQDNGTWAIENGSPTGPWEEVLGGDGAYAAVDASTLAFYASFQNGQVYRLDRNANGDIINYTRVDPSGATGQLFINPFSLDPADAKRMYYAGGQHVWRNNDLTLIPRGSQSAATQGWVRLTSAATGVPDVQVSFIAVSTAAPTDRMVFGTADGELFRIDNASQATTATQGTDITSPLFPEAYIASIAFDPTNGDRFLVAFSNYEIPSVFYTEDGGVSFTDVSGNLEDAPDGSGDGPSVRSVAVLPVSNARVFYAGTTTGLYSTTSLEGANTVWAQEGPSTVGNVVVDMVATRPSDGTVAIGTHGNGTFATRVSSVPTERAELPEGYALIAGPNPFRSSSRLQLTLSEAQTVRIETFDAAGRQVRALHDGFLSAGPHTFDWNGSGLASGTYFIRAAGPHFSTTRTLVKVQ